MADDEWPVVLLDALDEAARLWRGSAHWRCPDAFPPLRTAHGHKRPRSDGAGDGEAGAVQAEADLVENEEGLCDRMERAHARLLRERSGRPCCAAWRLDDPPAPPATPRVPQLAAMLRAQRCAFPLRRVDAPAPPAPLCPPLLFSSVVANRAERDAVLVAAGGRWLLPPHSAFALLDMRRWAELAALRPRGGYRAMLLDPPWHSHSARRAERYPTLDKRELLDALPVRSLACASGCLVCAWCTNSRHVQAFVEGPLFAKWGAAPIARWYWLKLAADGSLATGTDCRSPHRKPWELLVLGYIGPSPPPLPRRLVVGSVPLGHHSQKPPLDSLLCACAEHLASDSAEDKAGAAVELEAAAVEACAVGLGGDGCGCGGSAAEAARARREACWRGLPKCELFARDVKPTWHAVGDEALRFNDLDAFYAPRPSSRVYE